MLGFGSSVHRRRAALRLSTSAFPPVRILGSGSPVALPLESGLWYDQVFQRRVRAPPEVSQQLGERE